MLICDENVRAPPYMGNLQPSVATFTAVGQGQRGKRNRLL